MGEKKMELSEISGLEAYMAQFPVFEYKIIKVEELMFQERVRTICRQECERYGKTWACPPAVGSLEECEIRCRAYTHGLFFSTVAQVSDIMNMEELLSTRQEHENITGKLGNFMKKEGYEVFTLSTESCAICEKCTYPMEPCRFPNRMHPCLESHGVVVSDLVEKYGMTYALEQNTILWFSLILFRK
jgi:predicted metal-binding protein